MIGSYPPRAEPYTKQFPPSESPSGFLARSGTNSVRSRITDDDGVVYADFSWQFKVRHAPHISWSRRSYVEGTWDTLPAAAAAPAWSLARSAVSVDSPPWAR